MNNSQVQALKGYCHINYRYLQEAALVASSSYRRYLRRNPGRWFSDSLQLTRDVIPNPVSVGSGLAVSCG